MTNNPLDKVTYFDNITALDDVDWTFEGVETKYETHGLHPYPARMVPQIPAALFSYYLDTDRLSAGDTVWDPFSGSGTTSVEARRHNLNAVANDLNPLACLLTDVKSTPIENSVLQVAKDDVFSGLKTELTQVETDVNDPDSETKEVNVGIRNGWFPEIQLHQLMAIRDRIEKLGDAYGDNVERFFRVALSYTTRRVSYQRNGEYKRYRMPEEKREDFDPNVFDIFSSKVSENIELMKAYTNNPSVTQTNTDVRYEDSSETQLADESIDVIVTSPPYGDHSTTVAYGQFSQDPSIMAQGSDYDEMRNVDKEGLGGDVEDDLSISDICEKSESLRKTVDILQDKDGRVEDAVQFFVDYYNVLSEMKRVLKTGQPAVIVVANRTISRVSIPTHMITLELCEELGFTSENVLPREIPSKTLPFENAPENVAGETGDLMADENIVIVSA